MKKLFTLFMIALFAIDVMAELGYGVTLTQNDFNNSSTVVKKSGTIEWDGDHVRCGGSSNGISLGGPSWNWDDKYFDVKIANGVPNKLSFEWACNNVTSTLADWYVKESADGKNWSAAIWETTSSTASWTSVTKDLQPNTRYIRFCFSGNFAGNFRNIKVTEKILMGTPNPTELNFGTVKVDDEASLSFTLGWTNLTGTAISSDEHFTVTPDAFGEIGAYLQTETFTVTLNTKEEGEFSGTITVEGRDKSAEVAVSGTVEKYDQTIEWETADSYNFGDEIPVAVATSDLEVAYEISDESILKFENGAFVPLYAGEVTVIARQEGNYKYNEAEDVEVTFTIVAPTTYSEFEETTCGAAVEFFGDVYEESFAADVNVGENYIGGDSIVHVNIVINHPTFGEDEKEMTYGADEEWNGIALKDSTVGVHTVVATIENVAGCDSTVTLTLTVNKQPAVTVPETLYFCQGDSVEFRDKWYKEAGMDAISALGEIRDTLFAITIIENLPSASSEELTIIAGKDTTWHEYDLAEYAVGSYELIYTTTNMVGCDSTVTLALTVEKEGAYEVYYPIEFCAGDSAEYRGKWYYESGEDMVLVEDEVRDTVIYVTVAVLPVDLTELNEDTLHVGDTLFIEADVWYLGEELVADTIIVPTEEGEFDLTRTLKNEFECDSLIVRHIVVEAKPVDPEIPTGWENVDAENKAVKVLRDGVIYIRREGKEYIVDGRLAK